MNPRTIRIFAGVIAVFTLAGFLLAYGIVFYRTWFEPAKLKDMSAAFAHISTALAGLVGGVVAMFFNEKLPDDMTKLPALNPVIPPDASPVVTPSATGPQAGKFALRSIFELGNNDYLEIISALYCFGYLVAGILAIITWAMADSSTPDMVKNLALISFGLFIAIARSFVTTNRSS